ncbi:hypothetical protein [Sulfurirhabdus autotrophica]|uniref:Uncharacterized protein n=1 Tax=Sulfurirhabdus autotrophica TaxID=1706046 RepID=A0A4R3YDL3_9PROT|nr:hypothetical protein [Sulfurirhabdus autotrophica]TCV90595.1 hypothetical protein EDC63_101569 [Sulfurirhabdus autotrophica]
MRIKLACIGITFFGSTLAMANDQFTGVFNGTGRACNGALYLKAKTVEWHSTYSQCQSQMYRVLEHIKTNEQHKIVLVMKNPNKKCLYPVVEINHKKRYSWNINGYQSNQYKPIKIKTLLTGKFRPSLKDNGYPV